MYHFIGSFLSDSRSNPIRSDPIEFNAKQTLCFIHMFSILRVRVIEIAIENIDNILCKQCIKSHEKKIVSRFYRVKRVMNFSCVLNANRPFFYKLTTELYFDIYMQFEIKKFIKKIRGQINIEHRPRKILLYNSLKNKLTTKYIII